VKSTRRGFLRSAGLTGLGASAIGTGALLATGEQAAAAAAPASGASGVVPFYGAHQAGIVTPTQSYLEIAALDMVSDSVADLRKLLRDWSAAAARMAQGAAIGALRTGDTPPVDTGEALGLGPSELTMTFGFGPTLFTSGGKDRFGLARHRPAPLVDLPPFLGDALQPAISGGDLVIQVCANDPQVAFHAVHDLIKLGLGVAQPSWLLTGFGRTANSQHQALPRNLMGFQDGTANIKVEETGAVDEFVWASEPASPDWMRGGSYLVARRIQISLGLWDGTSLDGQQEAIGREKISGSLLSSMPPKAHLLMSSPQSNDGQQILRRGYSYVDGIDPVTGDPAAGLMFLCYQADPRRQFIPIQQRIAGRDALSVYLTHIGSAVFACPPGARAGGFVGQGLVG
jgi:deferrochelatase/peroxidase EfeB